MDSRLPIEISSDETNEDEDVRIVLGQHDSSNESIADADRNLDDLCFEEEDTHRSNPDSPSDSTIPSYLTLAGHDFPAYESSLSPVRESKSPEYTHKCLDYENVEDLFDPIIEMPSTSGLSSSNSSNNNNNNNKPSTSKDDSVFTPRLLPITPSTSRNMPIVTPSTSRKEFTSSNDDDDDQSDKPPTDVDLALAYDDDKSGDDQKSPDKVWEDFYSGEGEPETSEIENPPDADPDLGVDNTDNANDGTENQNAEEEAENHSTAAVQEEHIGYYEPEPMDATSDYEDEVQCVCLDDESDLNSSEDESAVPPSVTSDEDNVTPRKRKNDSPSGCGVVAKRVFRTPSSYNSLGNDSQIVEVEESPVGVNAWINNFISWSGSDRLKAIELLIKKCSADQVRHMMDTIEPLFQRDFISHLPKEVALQILKKLSPEDLLRAAQTSKYWRFLSDDNLLWKEQCLRIGITAINRRIRLMPLTFTSSWKAEYMRNKYIEHKWLTKPMSSAKILKAHDDHVITCLQFYGNIILSGSDDTTLKLWSAVTGKCLRTLIGHTGGVWSSQMYKKTVISGSTDRTLRVWDAYTGACLKILTGHTSTVRCMHLHEDRVVSGSRDATLRVWSVSEGQCLKVLVGHLAAVRCVQYDGKLVVSGAYDYYVKVWNPESGECLHTLSGHTNRVYSLQFDGQHIVSGSLDTSIIVWDVTSGSVKHTLTGHQSLTSGMELRDNILVSGNADSTVKVWDIISGQCLHTLAGPHKHQSAVTCLQLNNRFVITSSDDGTVKLWDVKTGEFIRNLVTLESGGSGGVVWRIRASQTKLVCAVGSRNGTEETKLMVMNFDVPSTCQACQ